MGEVSANVGCPIMHRQVGVGTVGFSIRFHHTAGGVPGWVESAEIPVAAYQTIHSASLQSQAAFDGAIMASAWGPFYNLRFTDPMARGELRAGTMGRLP